MCAREAQSQQKTRMTLYAPDRNVTEKKRDEEIKKERGREKTDGTEKKKIEQK